MIGSNASSRLDGAAARVASALGAARSVQARFLLYVAPLVVVSIALAFGIYEVIAGRTAEEQLRNKLDRLASIQASVLSRPMWNIADSQVELIVQALMSDSDVVGAVVRDQSGSLVARAGAGMDPAAAYSAEVSILHGDGQEARQIGTLGLTLSDARINAYARQRLALAAVLALVLLGATVGAALVANRRVIGRPLGLLLDSIHRVRAGERHAYVDWPSGDEIGRVVTAFNDMQRKQERTQAQLREANERLESRVAERTAKLADAEAEAQEARGRLIDAIENISEGFALFDERDRLIVANGRYREVMLGAEDATLDTGTPFRTLLRRASGSGRFPGARADAAGWIDRQAERYRQAGDAFVQSTGDGRWHQVGYRATGSGGRVAVHSDISEQKRISDELQEAKDSAEAANEAKSAFLATMSHEIRTPLNAIVGVSTLLQATRLDDEQKDHAQTISAAAGTLLTIINDILDFSKVEAGALELERIPIDLPDTAESTVELVASRAAEKGIGLGCHVQSDVPAGVIGDPVRLKQILLNLLNNAVKFTEEGEVVLTLSSSRPAPALSEGETTLLTLSVRDTGVGIPEDRLDRLFKSFSQVDASTTRRFGGTGLGLVITKRLVELMGGEITVESAVGRGTTFTVTIPCEAAPLPDRVARERRARTIRGAHVLVVDDNPTNRLILAEKLRGWELRPHVVATPDEALDRVAVGERFDVALIDFDMPGMNGLELSRRLRGGPAKAMPLVLFTSVAPADAQFRAGIEAVGFAAVLSKPAKTGHLLNAMATAIAPDEARDARDGTPPATVLPEEAKGLAILLVDDNRMNRKVGQKILKRLGYDPTIAKSGEHAIERCAAERFDVVLMDIEMPDMDGVTATGEIRARLPAETRPYIVALTANAMASDRESYLRAGMDDYLSKPLDQVALIDSLRRGAQLRHRDAGNEAEPT